MSESLLISLVTLAGTIVGVLVTAWIAHRRQQSDIAQLLMQAQKQIREGVEDDNLLWQWNRELLDHIFRGAPPPPPEPPEGLFHHHE